MPTEQKSGFILGLAVGIAVVSFLGFVFLLGDKLIGSEETVAGSKTANSNTAPTPSPSPAPTPAPTPTPAANPPVVKEGDHFIGPEDAPVTIIEFSDIQCPFCQRFHPTLEQIMNEYPGQIRWVYKHFPLDSIHPQARPSALASECVADQLGDEAFFNYIEALFAQQSQLGRALYISEATKLGANQAEFENCFDNQELAGEVEADYQDGVASGVTGTPGSFINGQEVRGALPYESVKAIVDQQL